MGVHVSESKNSSDEEKHIENFDPSVNLTTATDSLKIINLNDPQTWQPITSDVKRYLVVKGPDQGINANFDLSKREFSSAGIIQFNPGWFYKKMKNETKVHRSWLIYCEKRKCIYCFPCLLFGEKSESKFCNLETGFTNWRKLNPKVGNHEN